MFNEIDGDFKDVAIRTFKVGLPVEHELRKSLTKKPVKVCVSLWIGLINTNGSRMISNRGRERQKWFPLTEETLGLRGTITTDLVEIFLDMLAFLLLRWLAKYSKSLCTKFKWPNKIGGDPMKRNQSLHCQYHQDRGHTTEDCRTLCDYLEQLVKIRKLRQFLYQPSGQRSQVGSAH